MLELIAIIYLSNKIKKIVSSKGLRSFNYIATMILLWVTLELLGFTAGWQLSNNKVVAYAAAIAGAVMGGYLGYKLAVNADPIQPGTKD